MTKLEQETIRFLSAYGHVAVNALGIQVREMDSMAKGAQAHYEAIKDEPERIPVKHDGFISVEPTAGGYRNMARMFAEESAKAQYALDALEKLAELAEEES